MPMKVTDNATGIRQTDLLERWWISLRQSAVCIQTHCERPGFQNTSLLQSPVESGRTTNVSVDLEVGATAKRSGDGKCGATTRRQPKSAGRSTISWSEPALRLPRQPQLRRVDRGECEAPANGTAPSMVCPMRQQHHRQDEQQFPALQSGGTSFFAFARRGLTRSGR